MEALSDPAWPARRALLLWVENSVLLFLKLPWSWAWKRDVTPWGTQTQMAIGVSIVALGHENHVRSLLQKTRCFWESLKKNNQPVKIKSTWCLNHCKNSFVREGRCCFWGLNQSCKVICQSSGAWANCPLLTVLVLILTTAIEQVADWSVYHGGSSTHSSTQRPNVPWTPPGSVTPPPPWAAHPSA